MPLLKIITNTEKTTNEKKDIARKASKLIAAETGKPESYVMVLVKNGADMLFGGSDEPLAFCEMKSIGLPESQTRKLSAAICGLVKEEFNVDPARIYIEFADAKGSFWGWNSSTF
ncbi:MAG: phenylpyruvate tautomerase MIF-related protein [Alphaproteobacteria bacterium]